MWLLSFEILAISTHFFFFSLLGLARGLSILLIVSNNLLLVSLSFATDFYLTNFHSNLYFPFISLLWISFALLYPVYRLEAEVLDLRPSFFSNMGRCLILYLFSIALVALHTIWYVAFSFSLTSKYLLICILISLWAQVI